MLEGKGLLVWETVVGAAATFAAAAIWTQPTHISGKLGYMVMWTVFTAIFASMPFWDWR